MNSHRANVHLISLDPWGSPPLSLNKRLHWAKESRLKRDLGLIVKSRALTLGLRPGPHLTVWLRWQPIVNRRRDGDNPAPTTKACVDGLVAAGLIPDDTVTHVTHAPLEIVACQPGQRKPRLWLAIATTQEQDAA